MSHDLLQPSCESSDRRVAAPAVAPGVGREKRECLAELWFNVE